jgi:hypothetical protein
MGTDALPLLIAAQLTYKVSVGNSGWLSVVEPVTLVTTIGADHPDGVYGARLGRGTPDACTENDQVPLESAVVPQLFLATILQ